MGRYIRWQAILTLTGIAMTLSFLGFLSLSRTTTVISEVGGTYREGVVGRPQLINPLLAQYNPVDQDLSALIFDGLTRLDGQGKIQPNLATHWDVSDDGLSYEFQLRRNVRWQDGVRLTVDDVIFTIGLMQDPAFPGPPSLHTLWQGVTIEKVDDDKIRFTLPELFPAFLSFTTVGILPKHILDDVAAVDLISHPFNLQPIGTGPFILEEINAEVARLSSNPFYRATKSRLTTFELHFYPSTQSLLQAYQADEIEGISQITPDLLPTAQTLDTLNIYTAQLSGYDLVYLNLQNPDRLPFFQEAGVRQALLAGLDRQTLIAHALHGQGVPANSPILPWSWAYNPEQATLSYDPALALRLLDLTGWTDSDEDGIRDKAQQPMAFTLLSGTDPSRIKLAETIRDQWLLLGIKVELETTNSLSERLANRDYDAALAEILLAGDPDPYPFWHQTQIDGGQNYAGWDHTRASMLLETARTLTDRGKRNDAYYEFQQIFAEEVPSLILYHPVYSYGISQEVYEVQLPPMVTPSDRFLTSN